MLLARPVLMAVGACVAALGCRGQVDRVARASERAQPHLESYRRFERWAQRAAAAAGPRADADELGEMVFAPIRNARGVSGAWVQLQGDRELTLSLPARSPPPTAERWVALRDANAGTLQVAEAERCPGVAADDAEVSCVLISRRPDGPAAQRLTVTVAFAGEP